MTDRREEKPEGALCGAVIVFTGRLEIPRREAIATAKAIGSLQR
jgi:BRCT domain type II-containing protein